MDQTGMSRRKGRWVFSALVAFSALLLTYVLRGESSPLADYFLFNVRLPNAWGVVNAFPFILAAVISGNRGGGSVVLFTVLQFAQWFVLAYGLSTLFSRAMNRGGRAR